MSKQYEERDFLLLREFRVKLYLKVKKKEKRSSVKVYALTVSWWKVWNGRELGCKGGVTLLSGQVRYLRQIILLWIEISFREAAKKRYFF